VLAVAAEPADEGFLAAVMVRAVFENDLACGLGGRCCVFVGDVDGVGECGDGCFADFEERDVVFFTTRVEEDDAQAATASSACATASVDECLWVCGWIELNDNIDGWDI